MESLLKDIQKTATKAVGSFQERANGGLDYSEASLALVEEMLGEASEYFTELPDEQIDSLVQFFGCYILEIGRRQFGGTYSWLEQQQEPVLVVGEPMTHIAIATWGKVRARLAGDPADNIQFFFEGFSAQARQLTPGKRTLYI